jgi:hypothetical protein
MRPHPRHVRENDCDSRSPPRARSARPPRLAVGRARSDHSCINLGTPIAVTSAPHSPDFWQPHVGAGLTCAIAPDSRLEADADATRVKATNSPVDARSFMLGATCAL